MLSQPGRLGATERWRYRLHCSFLLGSCSCQCNGPPLLGHSSPALRLAHHAPSQIPAASTMNPPERSASQLGAALSKHLNGSRQWASLRSLNPSFLGLPLSKLLGSKNPNLLALGEIVTSPSYYLCVTSVFPVCLFSSPTSSLSIPYTTFSCGLFSWLCINDMLSNSLITSDNMVYICLSSGQYYGLNYMPTKFIYWSPNPQSDCVWTYSI